MRKLTAILATVACMLLATPAMAGVGELANGVNGVVTSPLDVAHGLLEPARVVDMGKLHPKLEKANVVTDRIGGVGVGVVTALERVALGLVDAVTFPFTDKVEGPYSPDARYRVLGAEAAAAE